MTGSSNPRIIESEAVILEDTGARYDELKEIKIRKDFNLKNPEDYIQVPVEDGKYTLLVEKYRLSPRKEVKEKLEEFGYRYKDFGFEERSKRSYIFDINWKESKNLIKELGGFMLPPKYFLNFLNTLKLDKVLDGNENLVSSFDCNKIYEEITSSLGFPRAEWLDSKFEIYNDQTYIIYPKINEKGLIEYVSEKIDDETLMINVADGISLDDLLNNNFTNQGLPKKNIKNGKLWYWKPINNRVLSWELDNEKTIFSCNAEVDAGILKGLRSAYLLEKK